MKKVNTNKLIVSFKYKDLEDSYPLPLNLVEQLLTKERETAKGFLNGAFVVFCRKAGLDPFYEWAKKEYKRLGSLE